MRPLMLKINNYRAFASVEIPMDSIEAASITGQNGAGKSTVCEAILWVLYGDGRSSGVDGVVKLGADEASVEMEYEHNGEVYKVIRKRSRGKKSDLQYLLSNDGGWRALTKPAIRETQDAINHDLSMDGTLFRHSSCVMQGDSAGICEATPAERKAILYQILEDRLAKFGPLHEAARATVKALDEAAAVALSKRIELESVAESGAKEAEALGAAENRRKSLENELRSAEIEASDIRTKATAAQVEIEKLSAAKKLRESIVQEMESLASQITEQRTIVKAADELLDKMPEIRRNCKEADRLEEELKRYDELKEKRRELLQAYRDKEVEIERKRRELEVRRKAVQDKMDFARRRREELLKRAALMDEVPCKGIAMADECRLLADARQALDTINQAEGELSELQLELTAFEGTADAEANDMLELQTIKDQGRALGYDADGHRRTQEEFDAAKTARKLLPDLTAAESRAEAAAMAIAEAERRCRGKNMQMFGAEQDIERIEKALGNQPDYPTILQEIEGSIESLRQACSEVDREIAVRGERLSRVKEAEAELATIAENLTGIDRKRSGYSQLQQAFSRDGIPALIIDAAVPAIEELANDMLSRLSDGRMTVRFVTQRRKTSGGLAETLDIIVSDSEGERAYEDFSGGEKLRIDLAVRIALGTLLARRSGAKIELLIMDEVCAPLDADGEDALIDCIKRLSSQFSSILLITHRESIRERLPQQIIVTKNGGKSKVEVK